MTRSRARGAFVAVTLLLLILIILVGLAVRGVVRLLLRHLRNHGAVAPVPPAAARASEALDDATLDYIRRGVRIDRVLGRDERLPLEPQ